MRSESPPLHSIVKYALIITEIAGNLRSSRLVDPASRACPPTGRALALTDRSGFAWHEAGPPGASHRKAKRHASDRANPNVLPRAIALHMTKGKPSTVRPQPTLRNFRNRPTFQRVYARCRLSDQNDHKRSLHIDDMPPRQHGCRETS